MKYFTKVMTLCTVFMLVFQSIGLSFNPISFAEGSVSPNLVIKHGNPDYILVGEERQLQAVWSSHEDAPMEDLTTLSIWSSHDDTIAVFNQPGVLLGKSIGEVTVTADIYGETASSTLNIVDYLRLEAQVPNNMLTIGDSIQLTAQAVLTNDKYIEDAVPIATFDSEDSSIADVSTTGMISAISEGETFINVRVGQLLKTLYIVVSKVEEEPIPQIKSGTVLPEDLGNIDRVIANIDKLGLNTVVVPVRFDVPDARGHELSMHPGDVEQAKALIDVLNDRGVNVILEAFPWIAEGTVSEIEYDPTDLNGFFWNYKSVVWSTLLHEIAIPKDVYAVIAGSSYTKIESHLWYWRDVFTFIRDAYPGKLTYKTSWWLTADWDPSTKNQYNEKKTNLIFGYVDFITIAAYFELNENPAPSTADLIADLSSSSIYARHQNVYDEVRSFSEFWGRDIFLGELGIPSVDYGTSTPWNPVVSDDLNEELQRNAYEAYQDVFGGESWFKGYSIWQVSNDTNNYYPVGKEAESTIRDFHPELASPIQSLTSNAASLQFIPGESRQLHIQGKYSNNGTADLTRIVSFNASNPDIASITTSGMVNAHHVGTTTIKVNYFDVTLEILVEVKPDTRQEKQLLSFRIDEINGKINEDSHTVHVSMPYGTDLRELVANFDMKGVSAEVEGHIQISGITVNDFTSPVIYSILARDGSVQTYTIIVEMLTEDDISKLQITGLPEKMIIGEAHTLVVKALFPDDSSIEVTEQVAWEVSNPNIIRIKDGQLQAMRAGTVNVFAQLGGIHSEEYSISVEGKTIDLPSQPGGGYTTTSQDIKDSGLGIEDSGEDEEEVFPEVDKSIFTYVINRSGLVQSIQSEMSANKPSRVYSDLLGHWGERYVQKLQSVQGVTGYPDGSFRPNNAVTRAEFSMMLDRVFSPSEGSSKPKLFKDLTTHWAKDGILHLTEQGVIQGYADGTFKPNQYLSRAEAVELVGRIVELKNFTSTTVPFQDINHTWNQGNIRKAFAAGLIEGRTVDQFVPEGIVTRAEATALLIRMLSLDPELNPIFK
ncbi:S-layer homology domain-containing protein [Paenibacillus sp. 1781tsa1]|uniref:S-layer homology domain-containing protein n=1 Tax=Paenibacillus sp. 1781tsa1 TaxID=2953810 RepID=UPI00209CFB5B|nr:S-layer homology domain-containing protein [Paenibacillus sp. 1781tsa1]MCP1186492.1 S-layer homology domain-containing protein [Paenibacillus sp. 1781tsa1]